MIPFYNSNKEMEGVDTIFNSSKKCKVPRLRLTKICKTYLEKIIKTHWKILRKIEMIYSWVGNIEMSVLWKLIHRYNGFRSESQYVILFYFIILGSWWDGSYKIYMKEQRCQKLKKSKKWGCVVLETKIYGKLESL